MNCPYCAFEGPRRALHAHTADVHASEVKTTSDPESGRRFYELQCPFCPQSFRKQIKPRGKDPADRKSTRLNSSHVRISYAVFCLKKKKHNKRRYRCADRTPRAANSPARPPPT